MASILTLHAANLFCMCVFFYNQSNNFNATQCRYKIYIDHTSSLLSPTFLSPVLTFLFGRLFEPELGLFRQTNAADGMALAVMAPINL